MADDHRRLKLQALVAAERTRLPLAQLARVTQRLGPPLIQLANLFRVLLLRVDKKKKKTRDTKKISPKLAVYVGVRTAARGNRSATSINKPT